jgi:hypothetical protein
MALPTHQPVSSDSFTPFGRYLLLERLAERPRSRLFIARPHGPQAEPHAVVIKIFHAERKPALDRLRILSATQHPAFVRVHADGVEGGWPYAALEWLDGRSLAEVSARAKETAHTLPFEMIAWLLAETACALEHAHRAEGAIFHGDVCLENIRLQFDGSIKLLGFDGHAAAPSAAGDFRALGAAFHELLTGIKFSSPSDLARLKRGPRELLQAVTRLHQGDCPGALADLAAFARRAGPAFSDQLLRLHLTELFPAETTRERTRVAALVAAPYAEAVRHSGTHPEIDLPALAADGDSTDPDLSDEGVSRRYVESERIVIEAIPANPVHRDHNHRRAQLRAQTAQTPRLAVWPRVAVGTAAALAVLLGIGALRAGRLSPVAPARGLALSIEPAGSQPTQVFVDGRPTRPTLESGGILRVEEARERSELTVLRDGYAPFRQTLTGTRTGAPFLVKLEPLR